MTKFVNGRVYRYRISLGIENTRGISREERHITYSQWYNFSQLEWAMQVMVF